jgi:Domain of unknown function (DUF397)
MTTNARILTTLDIAGTVDWFKSSYSGNGNNCVEIADLTATPHRAVAVRDSKDPDGPALLFGPGAFASFIADARAGRYDV